MALIPGTVGACPIQNIGAYGTEVGEFIETVEAFDRHAARVRRVPRADCAFGYRDSAFKAELDRWVITAVEFRLPAAAGVAPGLRRRARGTGGDGRRRAARARTSPRRSAASARASCPTRPCSGMPAASSRTRCCRSRKAEALRDAHPGLPVFGASGDSAKLSAAWMIEAAGWKGYRDGDAGDRGAARAGAGQPRPCHRRAVARTRTARGRLGARAFRRGAGARAAAGRRALGRALNAP
jgi:UDP-N-acetylmuramate dehydrogenase